ncbi:MAG TPA: EthD family reductase [Gemmatimonadaceae bacterium]
MASQGPKAAVVVMYNQPADPAAFERYYAETHIPLVEKHAAEIGFTRAELVKFTETLDGKPPTLYRQAELWFDSLAALQRGIATAGFGTVAGDLANFATGGVTAMISIETNS